MSTRHSLAVTALLLAVAVALGAFGAHALRDRLDAYSLGVWEKASFYHFVHAFGIGMVALLGALSITSEQFAGRICLLLLFGIFVFSGSLYVLAVTGIKWLGAITPIGGLSFIVAWLMLGVGLLRE